MLNGDTIRHAVCLYCTNSPTLQEKSPDLHAAICIACGFEV